VKTIIPKAQQVGHPIILVSDPIEEFLGMTVALVVN
jgi:hypothetical protein